MTLLAKPLANTLLVAFVSFYAGAATLHYLDGMPLRFAEARQK